MLVLRSAGLIRHNVMNTGQVDCGWLHRYHISAKTTERLERFGALARRPLNAKKPC